MSVDFFENGLLFYCQWAKDELAEYAVVHSETERLWKQKDNLLQSQIAAILQKYPNADHDEIVESYGWDLHLNQSRYPSIHRSALVIAIYCYLEDRLNGLCETFSESVDSSIRLRDLNGRGIERAILYLSRVVGLEFDDIESMSFIKSANQLRNKLVHAGGVLAKDSNDDLNRFVQQTNGLSGTPGEQVRIEASFIDEMIKKMNEFFDELDDSVQGFIQHATCGTEDKNSESPSKPQ